MATKVKDVYPQVLRRQLNCSDVNTYTTLEIVTPVIMQPGSAKKYVMNIHKIIYSITIAPTEDDTVSTVTVQLTRDAQSAMLNIEDGQVIDEAEVSYAVTGGAGGGCPPEIVHDFTDKDDKGILVYDQKIHLAILGDIDIDSVTRVKMRIIYTMKEVSASEVLDILGIDT